MLVDQFRKHVPNRPTDDAHMKLHTIKAINALRQQEYARKTGILVDIENLGKNTATLAIRQPTSTAQLHPGVWLRKSSMEVSVDNFTNIFDLFWDQSEQSIEPYIYSSNTPSYLYDQVETDANVLAAANGSFYFLSEIADRRPIDLPYNFCIRDTVIYGLPSSDDPLVFIKNGILDARDVTASGSMKIGSVLLSWVGVNSSVPQKHDAVLYNSKCCDVIKYRDPKTNIQLGMLNNENIYTPTRKDVVDLIITHDEKKRLHVSKIKEGGGSHYFDGLFILQIPKHICTSKIGDLINSIIIDGLDISEISSGISLGKSVHDPFFLDPVRVNRRDARSLIAKDVDGKIHFLIFDGSKYVPGFSGVSAKDVSSYFSFDRFEWAYFLDGGGSSRLVSREGSEIVSYANEFAFRKVPGNKVVWDWVRARQIPSSILIRTR